VRSAEVVRDWGDAPADMALLVLRRSTRSGLRRWIRRHPVRTARTVVRTETPRTGSSAGSH